MASRTRRTTALPATLRSGSVRARNVAAVLASSDAGKATKRLHGDVVTTRNLRSRKGDLTTAAEPVAGPAATAKSGHVPGHGKRRAAQRLSVVKRTIARDHAVQGFHSSTEKRQEVRYWWLLRHPNALSALAPVPGYVFGTSLSPRSCSKPARSVLEERSSLEPLRESPLGSKDCRVFVAASAHGGVGVFASIDIKEGDVVTEQGGDLKPLKDAREQIEPTNYVRELHDGTGECLDAYLWRQQLTPRLSKAEHARQLLLPPLQRPRCTISDKLVDEQMPEELGDLSTTLLFPALVCRLLCLCFPEVDHSHPLSGQLRRTCSATSVAAPATWRTPTRGPTSTSR